jgi:hypothetical protein
MKRALYRDQVVRVSIRALRSQFKPSLFRKLDVVTLDLGGEHVRVSLVRLPERTCFAGERRIFLVCPHCANNRVNVLGWDGTRWGCMQCLKWRGRTRIRATPRIPKRWDSEARSFTA